MWKKIQRNQGKLIGPKFKEYLKLNFQMVRRDYGLIVFSGILLQFPHESQPLAYIFLAFVMLWSLYKVVHVIGSKSLYQRDAYLYQSFPVSAFETVLAKTLVMGGAFAICGIAAVLHFGIKNFLMIPLVVIISLTLSGEVLLAINFGNNFRDNRTARPSLLATGINLTARLVLVVFVVYNLSRAFEKASWSANAIILVLIAGFLLAAVSRLKYNAKQLQDYYSL